MRSRSIFCCAFRWKDDKYYFHYFDRKLLLLTKFKKKKINSIKKSFAFLNAAHITCFDFGFVSLIYFWNVLNADCRFSYNLIDLLYFRYLKKKYCSVSILWLCISAEELLIIFNFYACTRFFSRDVYVFPRYIFI